MTELSAVTVDRAHLRLLGGWHLLVDGVEVDLGHREQRLVALLGLTGCSARAQVAAALWPDSTDERALASLRRAVLLCVRRCPGLLDARRATIALDPTVRVDVDDVRRAAGLTRLPRSADVDRELLVALRGDELLPGWYDDWVIAERDRLQHLRVEALDRISRHALDAGDLELAIEAAGAASDIDPILESAAEVSIRAHLGRGDLSRRRARVPELPRSLGGGARRRSVERDRRAAGVGVRRPARPRAPRAGSSPASPAGGAAAVRALPSSST